MSRAKKATPCKVDYISFTWSQHELLRLKEMAKRGARFSTKVKTIKHSADIDFEKVMENGYQPVFQRTLADNPNETAEIEIASWMRELSHCEDNAKWELQKILSGEPYRCPVTGDEKTYGDLRVDTTLSYDRALNNLRDNMGVDLLDVLCCGEVERFVTRLNTIFTNSKYQFKWTAERCATGRHNYTYAANLYADGIQAGLVCWGGKNLGCYVSLSGTGCDAIDMTRLHEAIKGLPGIKITRIDLAHDDMTGKHSIRTARKMLERGRFRTNGRPPAYMYVESGNVQCKTPDDEKCKKRKRYGVMPDKGRSLYIGARTSGKLLRIYEKGKQLGMKNSPWVRWELELHSKDRVIPLDAMICPDKYLAGSYPALSFLKAEQEKIPTIAKRFSMTIDRCKENHIKQSRKMVNFMVNYLEMSPDEIVNHFTEGLDVTDWPQRLNIPIPEANSLLVA